MSIETKVIDGKPVDLTPCVYLALYETDQGWVVSGVLYHNPQDAESNLFNFHPKRIVVVRVVTKDLLSS